MSQFDQPWAIEGGVNASAAGFARIVRLSDAARFAAPFSEPVFELFASSLAASRRSLRRPLLRATPRLSPLVCKPT